MTRSHPAHTGRRGFAVLDGLLALSLTVAMAAVLGHAVSVQQRGALAGSHARQAVDALEAAAARVRAGEPAGADVDAEPLADAPRWLRLTPADADAPELLVHLPESAR